MKHSSRVLGTTGLLAMMVAIGFAEDPKDEAIKKDRQRIEGTWRIVALEVDGNKAGDEDARKLTVVNGADGSWSLNADGREISQGTSSIDPTLKPKTIDLVPTVGDDKGKRFLGIYEVEENSRKLCLAPSGKARPTEFSSAPGSERILVTFERVKPK